MPLSITVPKFIGTTSLGLLTGLSYTLTTLAYPSLLEYPSAAPARGTFVSIRQRSQAHIRILATVSALSLGAAFALSGPRARHPYLLWTGLLATVAGSLDVAVSFLGGKGAEGLRALDDGRDGEVNGEKVEMAVRASEGLEGTRALIAGVGFVLGVVGLWGDGV